jgi:hypothetical protein
MSPWVTSAKIAAVTILRLIALGVKVGFAGRLPACADAQVTTLRERLLKLAVWVERSVRRIVLHLPVTFPWLPTWQRLARAVGATP